jgi:hypothetical protein
VSGFGIIRMQSFEVTVNGRKVVTEDYERRFGVGPIETRVALVGCSAQKALVRCPARDMYRSPLFRAARAYAEATCQRWFILSAKYGLLEPSTIIEPYDQRLSRDRERWGERVGRQIEKALPFPEFANAELIALAGKDYADAISFVDGREFHWDEPLEGLGIGERIRWLQQHTPRRA